MTAVEKQLRDVWERLRAKKAQLNNYLDAVHIQHLRGIADLRVRFPYPVSVLAGPNGCGKSTVLYACACAYQLPNKPSSRILAPASIFPSLTTPKSIGLADDSRETEISFAYIVAGEDQAMRWAKKAAWNRSFFGRPKARQPERNVFLRTLASYVSPSDVRSMITIGQSINPEAVERLTSDRIAFAHRILPNRYATVSVLRKDEKNNLLFIEREEEDASPARYSEFHMSAGERSILRLSIELSQLKDALVLVDEVETGLHPYTQQQLMLEFQRLALRNNLQIIITSHSPTILESVPPEARLFLERTADNVLLKPPYREIIQKAYYGQSLDKLSILCEDLVAQELIRGVIETIGPQLLVLPQDIIIGRDTGKDAFPTHIKALGQFQRLESFIFVLDGDGQRVAEQIRREFVINPLLLPGNDGPEAWLWERLKAQPEQYAQALGVTSAVFSQRLTDIERLFEGALDKRSEMAKNRLLSFADDLSVSLEKIARVVGRQEAQVSGSPMVVFAQNIAEEINRWKTRFM